VAINNLQILGDFSSPVTSPFPLPDNAGQVVDIHYFADDRSLVILLYGGDIATVQLDGPDGGVGPVSSADPRHERLGLIYQIEVIGSIDSGIKAACWSPDEEHLILVTG